MDTTELLHLVKSHRWDIQRFNGYPFFLSSAAVLSGEHLPWGLSYTHFLYISHSKNVEMYYDTADYERIGKIFWEQVTSPEDLNRLIEEGEQTYKAIFDNAQYDPQSLASASEAELKSLLWKQVELISAGVGTGHCIECATYVVEETLASLYPNERPEINASEISFLKQAEMYAHDLISSGKNETEITQEFNERFGWIKNSYTGSQKLTIADIRELAAHTNAEHQAVSPLPDSDHIISILSHVFSWQDLRKANILKGIDSAEPVLRACAECFRLPFEHIRFMLPDEIECLGDQQFHKELADRSSLFVAYSPYGSEKTLLTGADAKAFIASLEEKQTEKLSLIKGAPGYKGNVRGRARVCLSLESIDAFQEGEILVASMTRPEYVSAMKKAAAFITDEGGITCHAAIIAREMKKPCIIGTKKATKILKDGDMVEVDADRGIVLILD